MSRHPSYQPSDKSDSDKAAQAKLRDFLSKHASEMLTGPKWDAYNKATRDANGDPIQGRWAWKLKVAKAVMKGNDKP